MVDFGSLLQRQSAQEQIDPIRIFEELPKSSKVNGLYHVQAEMLRRWYDDLRDEKDVVVELNTGGGKTLVGLLMAMSTMREKRLGVLYLVENKQLANQVVAQAKEVGIPAKTYSGKASADADFDNGKCILVAPYQALFNGRSIFGIQGNSQIQHVGGIIIDDAHASLSAIRRVFSAVIPAANSNGLYHEVLAEFQEAFEAIEKSSTFQEFMEGLGGIGNDVVVEVPFWYWAKVMPSVSRLISKACVDVGSEDSDFRKDLEFSWPLLKDHLRYCQVAVSRRAITVAAIYPFVHLFPTFVKAERHIFMSATITDFGDMVRAYDLRGLKKERVIAPKTASGVGRKMILPLLPSVEQDQNLASELQRLAQAGKGVVRLAPRFDAESEITGLSFYEPRGHHQVAAVVEELQRGSFLQPVSFANRYNGIDLPDDACRVLIMEDLPTAQDDVDKLMATYLSDSDVNAQRLAQRLEQGMGRGVRGSSDHCAVLLSNKRLIDWMQRIRNRRFFSPALQAQLSISDDIVQGLDSPANYCEAIMQDVACDESWAKYHASRLAQLILEMAEMDRFGASFKCACAERRSFAQWLEHDYNGACDTLSKVIDEQHEDKQLEGWLLQLEARIRFDGGSIDAANDLQYKAHCCNRSIPYARLTAESRLTEWALSQAKAIIGHVASTGGVQSAADRFVKRVAVLYAGAPHSEFEEAIKDLGLYLGFYAERADKNGDGPDVYWISPDGIGFAIEVKNEKGRDTAFHKSEASQLRTAAAWLKQKHPDLTIVPMSIHPNAKADPNASAGDLLVLTLGKLADLVFAVEESILRKLGGGTSDDVRRIAGELTSSRLSGEGICSSYLVPFGKISA